MHIGGSVWREVTSLKSAGRTISSAISSSLPISHFLHTSSFTVGVINIRTSRDPMIATFAAARTLLFRSAVSRTAAPAVAAAASLAGATTTTRTFASVEPYSDYGKSVFTGRVADEYLKKHGASGALLKDPAWTSTAADTVAKAVLDW